MTLVIAFALILIGSTLLGYSISKLANWFADSKPEQWNEDKL